MGCWNRTCAATGMPIMENDKVTLIVFHTQRAFEDADDRWGLGSFHLFLNNRGVLIFEDVTYDEYGFVKELDRKDYENEEDPGDDVVPFRSLMIRSSTWNSIMDYMEEHHKHAVEKHGKDYIAERADTIERAAELHKNMGLDLEPINFDREVFFKYVRFVNFLGFMRKDPFHTTHCTGQFHWKSDKPFFEKFRQLEDEAMKEVDEQQRRYWGTEES